MKWRHFTLVGLKWNDIISLELEGDFVPDLQSSYFDPISTQYGTQHNVNPILQFSTIFSIDSSTKL